jgi:hypothetical protein
LITIPGRGPECHTARQKALPEVTVKTEDRKPCLAAPGEIRTTPKGLGAAKLPRPSCPFLANTAAHSDVAWRQYSTRSILAKYRPLRSRLSGKAAMVDALSCALKATIDQIRPSNFARNLTLLTALLKISTGGPP